jgi:hypothetical protein
MVGGLQYPRAGGGDAGIDEHLAVAAGQYRDVATRAFEDAHVATELVSFGGRHGRMVADKVNDAARLVVRLRGAIHPAVAAKPAAAAKQVQNPRCECVLPNDQDGKAPLVWRYDLKKARRSGLIVSACVVGMPWGKPLYVLSVPFFKSFAERGAESAYGTI